MMETTTVTDCLVLKIEERETDVELLDTTIYVIYDKRERNYVIRGKRRATETADSCTYSFVCKDHRDLADFLSFVICKDNFWTYVLYNYDNLSYDSDNITYEFLKENESNVYELTGYNSENYNQKRLCRTLRMLRNVFNYYY